MHFDGPAATPLSSTDPNVPAAFDTVIATGMAKKPVLGENRTTVELGVAAPRRHHHTHPQVVLFARAAQTEPCISTRHTEYRRPTTRGHCREKNPPQRPPGAAPPPAEVPNPAARTARGVTAGAATTPSRPWRRRKAVILVAAASIWRYRRSRHRHRHPRPRRPETPKQLHDRIAGACRGLCHPVGYVFERPEVPSTLSTAAPTTASTSCGRMALSGTTMTSAPPPASPPRARRTGLATCLSPRYPARGLPRHRQRHRPAAVGWHRPAPQ